MYMLGSARELMRVWESAWGVWGSVAEWMGSVGECMGSVRECGRVDGQCRRVEGESGGVWGSVGECTCRCSTYVYLCMEYFQNQIHGNEVHVLVSLPSQWQPTKMSLHFTDPKVTQTFN